MAALKSYREQLLSGAGVIVMPCAAEIPSTSPEITSSGLSASAIILGKRKLEDSWDRISAGAQVTGEITMTIDSPEALAEFRRKYGKGNA